MIVGGMLAGEYGALYGALSASNQSHTINEFTFLVKYDTGICIPMASSLHTF